MKIILCLAIVFCTLLTACMQDIPEETATPDATKRVIPTLTPTLSPTPPLPLLTPDSGAEQAPDLELIVLEKTNNNAVIVLNLADDSIDLIKSICVDRIKQGDTYVNFMPLSQEDITLYEDKYLIGIYYAINADIKQNDSYTFFVDIALKDNTVLSWESTIDISD